MVDRKLYSKKPTQEQMYWQAQQHSASINLVFLSMLEGDAPITKTELIKLIELRPSLWGRFHNYLAKLED